MTWTRLVGGEGEKLNGLIYTNMEVKQTGCADG